jgi:hypothetical protein
MSAVLPARLTFEDFWNRGARLELQDLTGVVPIHEAANAPSGQVLVWHDYNASGYPITEIDSLAGHPAIDSVVSVGPVVATTPLPAIRELFLWHNRDDVRLSPATAANLPSLSRLWVAYADVDLLAAFSFLEDLQCTRLEHPGRLQELGGLRRLMVGEITSFADVTQLAELRWLSYRSDRRSARSLDRLAKLERLEASGGAMPDLTHWPHLTGLRHLHLGVRVDTLDGLEAFDGLEVLGLPFAKRYDLRVLAALTELRDLSIYSEGTPPNLEAVGQLPKLRRLELRIGAWNKPAQLRSIDFIAGIREVEELGLWSVDIEDRRLDPLFELPNLRRLAITGPIGPNIEEFRQRRPDVEVTAHLIGEPEGRIHVGPVNIDHWTVEGLERTHPWQIFQDLTRILRRGTNDVAEDRLRATIESDDPRLAERLRWDSEAEAVGVYAMTEADIRAVAAVIIRLSSSAHV